MMRPLVILSALLFLLAPLSANAQDVGYEFQIVKEIETTPVKNQARTGTCWSFATTSFIETELIRMGKPPLDLSEMFFVRMTYPQKAENYVRLHGNTVFGPGSLAQDVLRVVRLYGVVPEDAYAGRRYGGEQHDHSELQAVLSGALDGVIETRVVSPVWPDAVDGILDAYLGAPPAEFQYSGRRYTPASFADYLGVEPDDYVELTSFSHHPFYTWFAIEIPDNWARNLSYNVPLDDLLGVINNALERGYSVAWDGDVSERSFCRADGVAVWPEVAWEAQTPADRDLICHTPEPEMQVDQEVRQRGFDNYTSSDDHLMHLVGIARDQNGTRYYITKNSWGITGARDGYVYLSESYVRAKTISILVNRDALPAGLSRRLAD